MESRRLALVVAVDQYDDPGLRDLAAPAADASALADVLADPNLGQFSVETVHNETTGVVAERVEDFLSNLRPADFALLHFSCHGLKDDSGELYLAARNTKITRLASTGLDASLIDRLMRRSRSQQVVLLLDCCYGGAFQRGVIARAGASADVGERFHQEALGGGRGRVVITASTAMEFAFEGSALADARQATPSVFTGAIVEGLRSGDADRDEDGRVSLSELYEFVYDEVKRRSPEQTPSKWEYGVQGNLIIAGTPRRRVRPRKLADDFLELMEHGHASVRMSAVSELGRLLEGEDLPLAAGARAALVTLSEDDSRRVSTAAREVLDGARLRLPVESHDFGTLDFKTVPPAFVLELGGPPLVQAAEVVSSSARLRATLKDRSLTVVLDTSVPGALDAEVAVSSPVGGATVHVRAHVRAPVVESSERPKVVDSGGRSTHLSGPGAALTVEEASPQPRTGARDQDPPDDVIEEASPGRRDDEVMNRRLRLTIIVAVIALAIAIGALVYFGGSDSGGSDSGGSDSGGSDSGGRRYGPPSDPFAMSGPWTLTVTSSAEPQFCNVAVSRPDGGATLFRTSGVGDQTEQSGQYVRTVQITMTGTFVLRWWLGDEDECTAQVAEDAGGTPRTISPP